MAEAQRAEKSKKKVSKPKATSAETNGEPKEPGARAKFRALHINLLAPENPKRAGTASFDRFAKYKDGMTVGDFLAAGGTVADIRWDEKNEYIKLSE